MGAGLPKVAVKDFNRMYRQASEQFAAIIDDSQVPAADAKRLLNEVDAFLDRHAPVIGDLRGGESNLENGYIYIEKLIKKTSDMVSEGLVYAGPD